MLLMALGGVVWVIVDSTRGATGVADLKLRAAIATVMAAHGIER